MNSAVYENPEKNKNIEVKHMDGSWKKHRQKYSGWTAQILGHECGRPEGIIL